MTATPDTTTPLLAAHRQSKAGDSQSSPPNVVASSARDATTERDGKISVTVCRVVSTYVSFLIVGAYDGSYGALLIYLRRYYHIDYVSISFTLLAPVLGYMIAAFTTNAAHFHFGQRGIAMLASSLHITAALAASLRPPYPLFLITCVLSGLANGVADAAWNAWIGTMPNSNGLMGLLHGFYGLGAAFSPMVATLLVEQIGLEWFYFYYVLGIAAVLEACTTIPAFWTANATVYRRTHSDKSRNGEIQTGALKNTYRSPQNSKTNSIFGAFQYKATWIISAFVFLYAGIEMSLADWISSYFIDSRGFPSFSGNMIAFGYWSGLTLGRVVIGFLASRMHWGKKTVHMSLLMSLSLWLALRFVVEPAACAVVVAFLGFFIGPMFPEAVVMQAKVLPQRLQLGAIGFACAFGSAGGSFFPFLTGVIAQLHGIGVLFIVVSGMLGVSWLLWLGLPMPSAPPRTQ